MNNIGICSILTIAILTVNSSTNADTLIYSWSEKFKNTTISTYLNDCTLSINKTFKACTSPTSASSSTLRISLSSVNGVVISDFKGGAIIRIAYSKNNEANTEIIKRCDGELQPVAHPKDKNGNSVANIFIASKPATNIKGFDIQKHIDLCRYSLRISTTPRCPPCRDSCTTTSTAPRQ